MAYVIGIDGGGSKTAICFERLERAYIGAETPFYLTAEASNPQAVGFLTTKFVLQNLIHDGMTRFGIKPDEISAMCLGLAGVGRQPERERVEQIVREIIANLHLQPTLPYSVHHDAHIALRGALHPHQESGILVIAGTGSIAYAIDSDDNPYRSGGWGHLLGDEGSGYWIGMQALQAVCRAADHRGPRTVLTKRILEAYGLQSEKELISLIYNSEKINSSGQPYSLRDKSHIAAIAKLVIQASESEEIRWEAVKSEVGDSELFQSQSQAGDPVAVQILERAADELVTLVRSIFSQIQLASAETETMPISNLPVTVAGSIFQHSRIVKQYFTQTLLTEGLGSYQEPQAEPIHGAVTIARELLP